MMDGTRLFIATPSFSSQYCSEYVKSLVDTIKDLQRSNIKTVYKQINGVHWVDIARDILAHIFLYTDCTHMIQIDADLGWSADAIRKMLSTDKDIIGGIYPIKADVDAWPTNPSKLPGGFLMVKRHVIEQMVKDKPLYQCHSLEYGRTHVAPLFIREMYPDHYVGEDYAFCNRAVEAGFNLHIETDITFKHVGIKQWTGNYSERAKHA